MLNLSHFRILFLILFVFTVVKGDCPISRYHPSFRLGQSSVQLTSFKLQELLQQNFVYSLAYPLPLPNPSVLIGITGFDYSPSNLACEFQILYVQSPSLTQIQFSITSTGFNALARKFSFRYMIIQQGYQMFQGGSFFSDVQANRISKQIAIQPLTNQMDAQFILFLNGIKASYSSLASFNIQISNPSVNFSSNELSFDVMTTPLGVIVSSISVSYLIYSKSQISVQNSINLLTLPLDSSVKTLPYNSLQYYDLTFYGLSVITFRPTKINIIDVALDDMNKFQITGTFDNLFKMTIWQSFIKNPFVCSFCKDGSILFEGTICVGSCPNGYISDNSKEIKSCKKCQISELKISDSTNSKCVCAMQHFQNFALNGQCTPCHYSCLSCVSESSNDCLVCDTQLKITLRYLASVGNNPPRSALLTGKCLCPQGYFDQDKNIKCQTCHPDCKTCSGAANSECIVCNSQRIKNQFNLCECTNGYSSKADGNCVCLSPKYQVNGICFDPINSCDINQIAITQSSKGKARNLQAKNNGNNGNINNNNNNNKNNNSSNNNSNSSNNNQNNNNTLKNTTGSSSNSNRTPNSQFKSGCQCKAGFFKVKGQCVACGQNMIYNDKKGRCQCVKEAVMIDEKCIVCEPGKEYDKKSKSCQCANKNQRLFKNTNKCMSCPQKSVMFKDKCICIYNYYMDSKGKCKRCNKNQDNPACKKVNH